LSTKVYTAYRIKPYVTKSHANFWQWVRDTMDRGEAKVKAVIRTVYASMMDNLPNNVEMYEEYKTRHLQSLYSGTREDTPNARLSFCQQTLRKAYKRQEDDPRRNEFDFNVSIAVHELEGGLYIIPYRDMLMRHTLDFLKDDKRLVDFAYWNNTDPPEGMGNGAGYRRWKARGKVWDALDARGWRHHMVLTICDPSKFMFVDPWLDMSRELSKARKASAESA
jgi:hypothetical protein